MPRRTLPHRGCDPVQIVQPFVFTAAQHQPILDALPCLRGEESEFIAGLEWSNVPPGKIAISWNVQSVPMFGLLRPV
jgi:hypothetical protein